MGDYRDPANLISEIQRLRQRVTALANTRPVQTGSGVPTSTPQDGALYMDMTNSKFYVRTAGVWKSATLT